MQNVVGRITRSRAKQLSINVNNVLEAPKRKRKFEKKNDDLPDAKRKKFAEIIINTKTQNPHLSDAKNAMPVIELPLASKRNLYKALPKRSKNAINHEPQSEAKNAMHDTELPLASETISSEALPEKSIDEKKFH